MTAKIIGETKDGFLVSMSRNDIAQLLGFHYGGASHCPKIAPGMEIAIGPLWRRLYALENSEGHIRRLAQDMVTFAAEISAVQPLIWPAEVAARKETT